jgi:AcrR family transcriptional regulator
MTLRERKKTALRNLMVRNGLDLFESHSYDDVSIDAIVAASMCSRSTFHRYFGSKEDLLFPSADERLETLADRLRAAPIDESPWVVARREVSAGLTGFLDDLDPDLRRRCVALWISEPALRRRYMEIVGAWEQVLFGFLDPRIPPSPAHDLEVRLLAASITSALRAALNTAMESGEDVRELIDWAFERLESGIGASLLTRIVRSS